MVDYILGAIGDDECCPICGDVDGDGVIGIADVTMIVDKILS